MVEIVLIDEIDARNILDGCSIGNKVLLSRNTANGHEHRIFMKIADGSWIDLSSGLRFAEEYLLDSGYSSIRKISSLRMEAKLDK